MDIDIPTFIKYYEYSKAVDFDDSHRNPVFKTYQPSTVTWVYLTSARNDIE